MEQIKQYVLHMWWVSFYSTLSLVVATDWILLDYLWQRATGQVLLTHPLMFLKVHNNFRYSANNVLTFGMNDNETIFLQLLV
jgi:hypothetical protein